MYNIIFFISLTLIIYSYLFYPLIILVLTRLKGDSPVSKGAGYYPFVTFVIAAHNEEAVIEDKILNTLKVDYPKDRFEILIGSDGSEDKTDSICSRYRDSINFMRIEPRQGKANVLNTLIPKAKGEIIVFSDANTTFNPDSINLLTRHFQDPTIGSVCGKLVLISNKENIEATEGVYWKYETIIKELESNLYSTIGANGGIYAIRKDLYKIIPADTIIDDFFISLNILEQNKRMIFDKDANAFEYVSKNLVDEFNRKVRIGAGNLQTFIRKKNFVSKVHPFISFVYLSHKVLRWIIPILLVAIYIACLKQYDIKLYFILFWSYNLWILTALATLTMKSKNRIINIFSYIFIFNLALLLGYFKYTLGIQKVTWRRAVR